MEDSQKDSRKKSFDQNDEENKQGNQPAQQRHPLSKQYVQRTSEIEDQKLQQKWVYWAMVEQQQLQRNDMTSTYGNEIKPVAEFDSVQTFWHVQSHFRRPVVMPFGLFLHLFPSGVKPVWEDESCKNGGRWTIRLPKTHTNKYWEDIIMALIGEQFSEQSAVLGVVLSLKYNNDKIAIWHKDGASEEQKKSLQDDIEKIIESTEPFQQFAHEVFQELLLASKDQSHHNKSNNYRGGRGGSRGGANFTRNQFTRQTPKQDEESQQQKDNNKGADLSFRK